MKRRALSLLLVLSLCFGMFPSTALAANEKTTIMLGSDVLLENANTANAATLYFGKNDKDKPATWRVLGKISGVSEGGSGYIDMIATDNMGTSAFDDSGAEYTHYERSTLRSAMDALGNKLTDLERNAIMQKGFWHEDGYYLTYSYYWPLNQEEAANVDESIRTLSGTMGFEGWWWLCHPNNLDESSITYRSIPHVNNKGVISEKEAGIRSTLGVRPAFSLRKANTLFVSAAVGGKVGSLGSLSPLKSYNGNEWKITAKDWQRNFNVMKAAINDSAITVNYTGATVGNNEYISVFLADDQNNLLYYGRVAESTAAEGEATIPIPDGLANGNYTLHVFSEQYNGGEADNTKLTDYASAFSDVVFSVQNGNIELTGEDAIIADRNLLLGSDALKKKENTEYAATVYFGQNDQYQPASWRVVGSDGSGAASEAGKATLIAAGSMGTTTFGYTTAYQGSELQTANEWTCGKAKRT